MRNVFSLLSPVFIGGVIGYITNDIAIKMLFRPHKPVYIGRFRLPLTPGIVPKHKDTLAVLLGREVEEKFFGADDLELIFRSDAFTDAVAGSLTDMLYAKESTLCLALERAEASPGAGPLITSAKAELCAQINAALIRFDFTPVIEAAARDAVSGRLPRGVAGDAIAALAPSLSDGIRKYLSENGDEIIPALVDEMITDFADRPVSQISASVCPDRDLMHTMIAGLYRSFMALYIRRIVESIDVGGSITDKVRQMDTRDIEALVLSVVNREFRYVVWLGGLLGMIIGAVNIFI